MSRVLVIGESWFVHSIHQKGFDTFTSSEYQEGGGVFLEALRSRGHDVTYVPSHMFAGQSLDTAEAWDAYDVVVISDVGANTFQLAPVTFNHSVPTPDRIDLIRARVERGGAVLMVGGYMTFTGIEAKARWGTTSLAAALPVTMLDRDDRVEMPAGPNPEVVAPAHGVVAGLDSRWPALLGLNQVSAKDDAEVLATCGGHPLLVVGTYGRGRSAAFTSDIAPHWAPAEFLAWDGYAELFDRLITWLAE